MSKKRYNNREGTGGDRGSFGALGRSLDAPIHEVTAAYGKNSDGVLGRMVTHFDNALNKNRGKRK